jgi:hypothetical protein
VELAVLVDPLSPQNVTVAQAPPLVQPQLLVHQLPAEPGQESLPITEASPPAYDGQHYGFVYEHPTADEEETAGGDGAHSAVTVSPVAVARATGFAYHEGE